jgi:hypothetical protein
MKAKDLGKLPLFILVSALFLVRPAATRPPSSSRLLSLPQEIPAKKPKSDYMSTLLSRNTNPLGFREDQMLKRLIRQGPVKWAVRAGARHILD